MGRPRWIDGVQLSGDVDLVAGALELEDPAVIAVAARKAGALSERFEDPVGLGAVLGVYLGSGGGRRVPGRG